MPELDPPSITAQAAERKLPLTRRFKPSAHGLRFPNAFPGAPLPTKRPPFHGSVYGLCGGMCFAVLDYLHAGQPAPDFEHVPDKDTRFWRYLYRRQFDSFGPAMWLVLKYAAWTLMPPAAVRRRTSRSLERTRMLLEADIPVVLGIVYVGVPESLAVWKNHQVLAYRYEQPEAGVTDLFIYDPNHPGDDSDFIRCVEDDPGGTGDVTCTQHSARRKTRPIRGFFPVPYRRKRPPRQLDDMLKTGR